jgi:hypothetical protein
MAIESNGMKFRKQYFLVVIALLCYILGVKTLLQVPTLILTPWSLVIIFTPVLLWISTALGFIAKFIIKSKLQWYSYTSIIVSICCASFFISEYSFKQKIIVQLDESEPGFYFIIATTDTNKVRVDNDKPIRFDSNHVIYMDTSMFYGAISPINLNGDDISNRLKSYWRGETEQHFYNPTDEEHKLQPNFTYYHKYSSSAYTTKLEALGYILTDTNLIR